MVSKLNAAFYAKAGRELARFIIWRCARLGRTAFAKAAGLASSRKIPATLGPATWLFCSNRRRG